MDKATLFRLVAPGRLPERRVFVLALAFMLVIFVANLYAYDASLRLYVLYVIPLLAIGIHSPRRSLYFAGVAVAIVFEIATFLYHQVGGAVLLGNLFLEAAIAVVCLSVADIARTSYLKVVSQAGTDELTGLLNRRAFARIVRQEIERQVRYGGEFSILLLDLDGFKRLNDTRGHLVGDQALKRFADAVLEGTRRSDSVARFGGDEFVVMLPNTSAEACVRIGRQLREAIVETMVAAGYEITASIGGVTFGESPGSVDKALKLADEAMYRAKERGGDCVVTE